MAANPLEAKISAAVESNTPASVTETKADKIATAAVEEIMADPRAVNTLNQEKWWQSGVQWFGSGGVVWSIGSLLTQVMEHGADFTTYDAKEATIACGSLALFAGVLYRRFWPGLKPLFWRWSPTPKGE